MYCWLWTYELEISLCITRELIAERVRDSIRTRKRHGKLHGGLPPFGYISSSNGLQVDLAEAEMVRFSFAEFLRTKRYTSVMTAVREAGFCSSIKTSKSGRERGGKPISPGTVYGILQNPIYVGEIRGHDRNYERRKVARSASTDLNRISKPGS